MSETGRNRRFQGDEEWHTFLMAEVAARQAIEKFDRSMGSVVDSKIRLSTQRGLEKILRAEEIAASLRFNGMISRAETVLMDMEIAAEGHRTDGSRAGDASDARQRDRSQSDTSAMVRLEAAAAAAARSMTVQSMLSVGEAYSGAGRALRLEQTARDSEILWAPDRTGDGTSRAALDEIVGRQHALRGTHVLLRSAYLTYDIMRFAPYTKGNGYIARALVAQVVAADRETLPVLISCIQEREGENYRRTLRRAIELKEPHEFVAIFAGMAKRAADDVRRTVIEAEIANGRMMRVTERTAQELDAPNHRGIDVLSILAANPVISYGRLEGKIFTDNRAGGERRAIYTGLVEAGLAEQKQHRGHSLVVTRDAFNLVKDHAMEVAEIMRRNGHELAEGQDETLDRSKASIGEHIGGRSPSAELQRLMDQAATEGKGSAKERPGSQQDAAEEKNPPIDRPRIDRPGRRGSGRQP